MKEDTKHREFWDCFTGFLSDPEGISTKGIVDELREQGVNIEQLELKVMNVVKRGLALKRKVEEK